MTKEQIIKLLDKEVQLALIEEDENSNGEMYISNAQLKTAEKVLEELEELRDKAEKRRKYYIKRLKEVGTEKNVIFENADDKFINNSTINLNAKLYLVGNGIVMSNNFIKMATGVEPIVAE